MANKKPSVVLSELYDGGTRLKINQDTGALRAYRIDGEEHTEAELALMRKYRDSFRGLLVFSEEKAQNIAGKALSVIHTRVGPDPEDSVMMAVWDKIDGWEDEFNDAFAEEDMGRIRWASRNMIVYAYEAIKRVRTETPA